MIGVIPARGGSKNMRAFSGAPLVEWVLRAALGHEAGLDQVIVSSNDHSLLNFCAHLGGMLHRPVTVLVRPEALSGVGVPDWPVFADVLGRCEHIEPTDIIVHLRPTAPFVMPKEIEAVATTLRDCHASTVKSVIEAEVHPYKTYFGDGHYLMPASLPAANAPRQYLPLAWAAAGYIDAMYGWVIASGAMEFGPILAWYAPAERVTQLDTEQQWGDAEELTRAHNWRPGATGS